MSNKNNINDFLNITTTEYKPSISNIKIINKNSVHQIQQGGNYSPTSSFNQLGGVNNRDVNNLVSMLTSDSHMDSILNSNTSTPQLENKLKQLLNQEGGNYNNQFNNNNYNSHFIKQDGGATKLLALGAAAALAYGLTTETDFVSNLIGKSNNNQANVDVTTTDMNNASVTSSAMPQPNNVLSTTSQSENVFQKSNNSVINSVTSSAVPNADVKQVGGNYSVTSDVMSQEGGNNPALVAYREIVKMVVKELGITYPKALKIAAQVQKDVKEKNADVTPDKLFKLASEQFKSTKSKYEKMVPK